MPVAENTPRSLASSPSTVIPETSQSPEWQLVQRIIASPAFVRSTLLTNFLLYVCDRKLRAKEDEVTEHQIGVHALGRPDNYHPGEDNIVRNYARILRKRLEEFFEGEGQLEELRILIPRGQYVPIFEHAPRTPATSTEPDLAPHTAEAQLASLDKAPEVAATRSSAAPTLLNRRNLITAASAALGISALGWFGVRRSHLSGPAAMFSAFWSQIFNPARECFVVTGDSGLVLLQRLTGRDISLNDYVNGTMTSDLRGLTLSSPAGKGPVDAGTLHFTSTTDLNIAIAIDRLAMASHANTKIRNARDMRMTEVKSSNGIFIGGPRANPWIELFAPHSNFQMKFYPADGADHATQSIWNKHPRPGEQQEYRSSASGARFMTYTMVSFLQSLDDEGWVLILQGENLPATGAAGEFVTNMVDLTPVLEKARRSDGTTGPFELILETQAIGTEPSKARVVAERYDSKI